MKELRCGDVVAGCPHTVQGETEEEVLAKVAEHASQAHGVQDVTPELAAQVRANIHDVPARP
ncbi:DUF1059 domain-containing protein [Novispirillum sp. DQ9]|uniref:DUF1059 domain-containing protein n=1 Tax=Novispirillum sp. DQ9 TaxID=3398612 RepID=UPI003C7E290C